MRVLITGHRGYIGAHAIDVFQKAGHHVTGVDVGLYDGVEFGTPAVADNDITMDVFDITADMLKGIDAVVALAAISNDPMGDLDPALTHKINTAGVMHCAEMAKSAGVPRFLFASSCSVYGAQGDTILDESAAFAPVSAYAESKINTEAELQKIGDENFAVTSLRNSTAYGQSPRLRTDLAVNNLLAYAVSIDEVKLMSDGTSWRPLAHCRDIARAFCALSEAPIEDVRGLAVNIGGNVENYQIRDVAKIVHEQCAGSQITIATEAANDPRDYRVSFDLLGKVLPNFELEWNVAKAVKVMFAEYNARENFKAEFEGGRYTRLVTLQGRLAKGDLPHYFTELSGTQN
ncbi:MAG: NAD-dependent epimerase/dehydratase family protein [Planctomycetes bacterium]|jgi:nucleoside-diphosphate-sugar epimerase|nr:NAD-dependent epimerase/dehydratase family protein [Planctomycetota bacterium]MBT4029151.1 NAD-dependent epimerase/dehydratase family protein [Planctomycetota bacterium]MBT4559232.1 NAD-dependent epimerase/dehydratase family protein [Planctomycetota bacterium]MBT5101649.1 NAD-dependent epimerase/dehydratase family protein [Planctomycetota bacterium]MBT7012552.1 NAD-dependent epimerase/dehydratase family protein [Planctomycetota bacterium]